MAEKEGSSHYVPLPIVLVRGNRQAISAGLWKAQDHLANLPSLFEMRSCSGESKFLSVELNLMLSGSKPVTRTSARIKALSLTMVQSVQAGDSAVPIPRMRADYLHHWGQGTKRHLVATRPIGDTGGKLIVSRDVSFNEFRSSKEGEIANLATNKGHLSSPNIIEGEIYHEISHDGPQGGAPQMTGKAEEQDFALEEVHEEQHIDCESPAEPTHIDQPQSSTARPTRVRRVPERYGTWFPIEHAVKDEDLLVDDSGEALITEDGSPSSYDESQLVRRSLIEMQQCERT
ncbi:hypothetical protein AXG93_3102s1520 [Marchantia polymorpha subsp. ruderalis]|uniref:Uncharacterized protein n=1 Tax=Marchantia polymorpha subsp. ruderalis TaxID=1480154 RepID=A0A176WAC1_MARPO|nr:hypothetical protein AXG93_3102s1520 [Marchantia polymorpha subsp. ruderalis]